MPSGAWQSQHEIRKPQEATVPMVPGTLAGVRVFQGGCMRRLPTKELFCWPRMGWYEALVVAKEAATSTTPPRVPLTAVMPTPV